MNNYATKDFYKATFLVAKSCPLKSHTRTNGITTFIFDETSELLALVRDYDTFTSSINPQLYGAAMKSLKSLIHADANAERTHQYVTPYERTK